MEYHLPDGLLDAKPEVPEAERTALMNILQTHYNGINQEDTRLLFSVIAPESPYKKMIDDWLQSGVFKELDFNIHADSSSIVLYEKMKPLFMPRKPMTRMGTCTLPPPCTG